MNCFGLESETPPIAPVQIGPNVRDVRFDAGTLPGSISAAGRHL